MTGHSRAPGSSQIVAQRDSVLDRIAQGEPLVKIALSMGYTNHSAIINRLGAGEDYKLALKVGSEARLETREAELEKADDSVTVSRARELLSHARWRAERIDPDRWGAKSNVLNVQVNVGNLDRALGESILGQIRAEIPQSSKVNEDPGESE